MPLDYIGIGLLQVARLSNYYIWLLPLVIV